MMYFDMFGLSTLLAIREALGDSRLLPLRHEPRFVSMFHELEWVISARIDGSEPLNQDKDFPLRKINEEGSGDRFRASMRLENDGENSEREKEKARRRRIQDEERWMLNKDKGLERPQNI